MKKATKKTVNEAADWAGANSALYELGGLVIVHDASGCNSTYATHDEPRWDQIPSLMFISALTEYDAILGNDQKLIDQVVEAAEELEPRFIALYGSPIATVMGTDFIGIAREIETITGIPAFGLKTSGMNSYIHGASQAYQMLVKRFVKPSDHHTGINLLGVTPLDHYGSAVHLRRFGAAHGMVSCWSMGCTWQEITDAGQAAVNVVVSADGLAAAEEMEERFGIPYCVGVPIGTAGSKAMSELIEHKKGFLHSRKPGHRIVLIGEPVQMHTLAWVLEQRGWDSFRVVSASEQHVGNMVQTEFEEEIAKAAADAEIVIADPLLRPICPPQARFIALPRVSYSGRMYLNEIPDLVEEAGDAWLEANQL
ncbi:MAG: nitrogenase component 1 [Catenisphaera adipataccumulans]|jgi:nitrogenase molybdenum-cofactor synthesis protein NifE|uniref:nitrogenase component 1 n=1 Tax=Catenisphaera adipataccumulans TaxID=700500 RepID=UPI003D8AC1A7